MSLIFKDVQKQLIVLYIIYKDLESSSEVWQARIRPQCRNRSEEEQSSRDIGNGCELR